MPSSDHARTDANVVGTRQEIDAPLTQRRSADVRYEIVDCEGKTLGPFKTAAEAGAIAIALFGDRQDPDRTGAGWDVQVVGS
jgi:hypothetical protein